ncbi:hypothetical protein R5W23_003708 [Gemmata sp. JC673]|uniref:DUF3106 domain-containing protein n=1 Tax=Gemmata algarum TaxID=2975278 RepID=A0ABU5F4D3_9BACT|nr:hypothetical protein [Gemmata algarum]MDY3562246.1 hypothetical protein [Gemmata algarum]
MRFNYALVLAGGFSLTSVLHAQPAQPGKAPVAPAYNYPAPLYRMPDVGKSLNLTPEQVTNLNKLTDATQARYRDDYAKLGTLNDAERFARTQELNQKYYADWNKGARDVFNDTQRSRYQQMNYQYGGFGTLYDPEVQRQLNLTAEQQRNLRAQYDWSNQQLGDIHRVGATDATKGAQMYRDYWTARQDRFNKYLTAEQQKTWNQMVGDPYSFRPNFTPQR